MIVCPGCGAVEFGPKICGGEDGVGAAEGCDEEGGVVEVGADYFDAGGGLASGAGGVPVYAADFPARFLDVEVGDVATLFWFEFSREGGGGRGFEQVVCLLADL